MKGNEELKEINIKNCTCFYFDKITKTKDFDFDNIFMNKKSNENILFYYISHKTLFGAKTLCIRFHKIEGLNRFYYGTRYLVLFRPEKSDATYNRIRYFISKKSGITHVISYNYTKIKVESMILCP